LYDLILQTNRQYMQFVVPLTAFKYVEVNITTKMGILYFSHLQ